MRSSLTVVVSLNPFGHFFGCLTFPLGSIIGDEHVCPSSDTCPIGTS